MTGTAGARLYTPIFGSNFGLTSALPYRPRRSHYSHTVRRQGTVNPIAKSSDSVHRTISITTAAPQLAVLQCLQ